MFFVFEVGQVGIFFRLAASDSEPEGIEQAGEGDDGERQPEMGDEFWMNKAEQDDDPAEHDGAGHNDRECEAGRELRIHLGLAAEGQSGGGAGGEASDEPGERHAGTGPEHAHQNIADEAEPRDEDDHEPERIGIDRVVGAVALVRHEGEHHSGHGDKLEGRADIFGRETPRPGVALLFQAEHKHGDSGDSNSSLVCPMPTCLTCMRSPGDDYLRPVWADTSERG